MQFLCYVTFSNADSRISIFFRNFERPFTPRTWLRSARNFGKTRFRRFAIFHFSTPEKKLDFFFAKIFGGHFFFEKVRLWRGYEFLIRVIRCVLKSYCLNCPYFGGDFLGEGVNDSICVETLDLAPKMTSTIWCLHVMTIWQHDDMILWYSDLMILIFNMIRKGNVAFDLHRNELPECAYSFLTRFLKTN